MNKTTRILLVLVVLAAAAWYLISKQPWKTSENSRLEFAVQDTASITKFFIADRNGHQLVLQKQANETWTINGKEPADIVKVNLLKETLHDVEVRNPVTDKEFNHVVANLATYGVKTEIYKNDELIKTIYVGEATPDGTGTYMIVEGAKNPYVAHIPGFIGYLTPRFLPNPVKWKSKLVFDYSAEIIQSIKVEYPSHPEASFEISQPQNNIVVSDLKGAPILADPGFARFYLGSFSNLYLEGYVDEITKEQEDSILAIQPFCIIQVLRKDGLQKKLTVTFKGIDQRTKERYTASGEPLDHDGDKFFARVDDEKNIAYIQQYNFGRLFRRLQDFAPAKR